MRLIPERRFPDEPAFGRQRPARVLPAGRQADPAVKGMSFHVERGETVALVGESGSGKSVSALSTVSLLGDTAEVEGSVTYDGQQMIGANDALLRKVRGNDISFIFQEPMTSLNPLHTIEKQLAKSLALHQGLTGAALKRVFWSCWRRSVSTMPKAVLVPIRTSCLVGNASA